MTLIPATGRAAPHTRLSQQTFLTLIHRDDRNILGPRRDTDDLAPGHLPLYLCQVPKGTGDASGEIRSVAHNQAELWEKQRAQNLAPSLALQGPIAL